MRIIAHRLPAEYTLQKPRGTLDQKILRIPLVVAKRLTERNCDAFTSVCFEGALPLG